MKLGAILFSRLEFWRFLISFRRNFCTDVEIKFPAATRELISRRMFELMRNAPVYILRREFLFQDTLKDETQFLRFPDLQTYFHDTFGFLINIV